MSTSTSEKLETLQEKGDAYLRQHQYEEALLCYNKLIFLNPTTLHYYTTRAQIYLGMYDFKSALNNLYTYLRYETELPPSLKVVFAELVGTMGYYYLQKQSYSDAIYYLDQAIANDPLSLIYLYLRCLALIKTEEYTNALKDIDHLIEKQGKNAEYYLLRAKLLWKLGYYEKGNQNIHKAYSLASSHEEIASYQRKLVYQSQSIHEKATKYIIANQYERALEYLNQGEKYNNEDIQLYLLRASVYRYIKVYQKALTDIETSLHLFNPNYSSEFYRNIIQNDMKELGRKELLEIFQQKILILNDMAIDSLQKELYTDALDALNQAIDMDSLLVEHQFSVKKNWQLHINRGDCYRRMEKLHAALADYNNAAEADPTNQDIRTRISIIHSDFGIKLFNEAAWKKAELEFSTAIEYDSTISAYYAHRGDAVRYQEKYSLAHEDYREALRLNPNDEVVKTKLYQYKMCTKDN